MAADPIKGSMAVINVIGSEDARDELEGKIQERMKVFPVSYTVKWTR